MNLVKDKVGVAGQSGAVIVVQRTSSDLRLNPHVHAVLLDGGYVVEGERVVFHALPRLSTRAVAEVLEDASARMTRYLRRRGLLAEDEEQAARGADDEDGGSEAKGLASRAGRRGSCASS